MLGSNFSNVSANPPSLRQKKSHEMVCPSFSAFSTLSSVRARAELRRRRRRETLLLRKEEKLFTFAFLSLFLVVVFWKVFNINGAQFEPIWSVVRIQNHVVVIIFLLLRGTSGGGKNESATDQQRSDENNNKNNNKNRFRGGDDGDDDRSNDHQNTPLRSIIQRRAKALTEATAGGFYVDRIYRGPNRE